MKTSIKHPAAEARMSLDAVSEDSLRRIHRGSIESEANVRKLLDKVSLAGAVLESGVDKRGVRRTATISSVGDDRLTLSADKILASGQPQIYFSFELASSRYFFASSPIEGGGRLPLQVEIPEAVYEVERRDLHRTRVTDASFGKLLRLAPVNSAEGSVTGRILNMSYQGLGVSISRHDASLLSDQVRLEFVDGERAGEQHFGEIRHREAQPKNDRDIIGLRVSSVAPTLPFPVDRRDHILSGAKSAREWRKVSLASARRRSKTVRTTRESIELDQRDIEVVSFPNERGQEIRGIVDRAHGGKNGTAVVIPPAWGRTKETFLGLARSIVAIFEAEGQPVTVLRFDGTNRRGESYIDPECRAPGDEHLHFSFKQAIQDIEAARNFLDNAEDIEPKKVVLVSFSLGSVEARSVIARNNEKRFAGWISVVGMIDLQSGLRTISGGVDYAYGMMKNVRFGRQELVGVVTDLDRLGRDGFEENLVFLEDVRRDMAKIKVPITWLHGRDDAWVDLERVQIALASGESDDRKLIEIPTGHQMRSSLEALETFQLVSAEALRMATGKLAEPQIPDLEKLRLRTRAEQGRIPAPQIDALAFWRDYLLGRQQKFGFELLSGTSAYHELMTKQIERLSIEAGQTIVDLGAGNGDFPLQLTKSTIDPGVRIIEVDLIAQALKRGRSRLRKLRLATTPSVDRIAANLELNNSCIPIAPGSADSVLASLFLSYVEDPNRILEAVFALLKPGGKLVISSMKRDADISKIYVDSIAELPPDRRLRHFGLDSDEFTQVQRVFLNDAARLLHLEEVGRFNFWDGDELASMCESAGFNVSGIDAVFGNPTQAMIVTATRPSPER